MSQSDEERRAMKRALMLAQGALETAPLVCEDWRRDPWKFAAHLSTLPGIIERRPLILIDPHIGYAPGNLRFGPKPVVAGALDPRLKGTVYYLLRQCREKKIPVHKDWANSAKTMSAYLSTLPKHDDPSLCPNLVVPNMGYVPGNIVFGPRPVIPRARATTTPRLLNPYRAEKRLRRMVRLLLVRLNTPNDPVFGSLLVHPEWRTDSELFLQHLLTLPGHDDLKLALYRTDTSIGYEPGNLEFRDPKQVNAPKPVIPLESAPVAHQASALLAKRKNFVYNVVQECTNPKNRYFGREGYSIDPGWAEHPKLMLAYLGTLDGFIDENRRPKRLVKSVGWHPGNIVFS